MTTIDLDELIDSNAAAAYLGVTNKRISQAAQSGQLVGRRIGRSWAFTRDAVDAYAASRQRQPGATRRTRALEEIIRELYGCLTDPEPIDRYLTRHQALALEVIGTATDGELGEDDDEHLGEDDEVACPACNDILPADQLDDHVSTQHPLRPVAGY